MNNGKTGYYICFKSDHLSEMLGSYSFSVGATRCPKLTVDYHRKAKKEVVQKRPLSIDEGAGSETKRLKVALDTEVAENRRMQGEVLELRKSVMDLKEILGSPCKYLRKSMKSIRKPWGKSMETLRAFNEVLQGTLW